LQAYCPTFYKYERFPPLLKRDGGTNILNIVKKIYFFRPFLFDFF